MSHFLAYVAVKLQNTECIAVALAQMRSAVRLTFKEVDGLEHVGFGDSILFCGSEEQGDLLHLLERHGGACDLLDGLAGTVQAVDELAQHLQTERGGRPL